jgi:urocanate hydratase
LAASLTLLLVFPLHLLFSMQLMIMNNLDRRVAQFPQELITYGGNGSVLSNWAQYHLLMKYLSEMGKDQCLSMNSGHPAGLFPSPAAGPRCVIANGNVIPNYSSPMHYDKLYATGCSIYGQMTAGSWVYIGPQGIVHGTTITILNAGRKFIAPKRKQLALLHAAADGEEGKVGSKRKSGGSVEELSAAEQQKKLKDSNGSASAAASAGASAPAAEENPLVGAVYVSSGLGGMSGAQGKAGRICGCVSVIAEIDPAALGKRLAQGWIDEKIDNLDELVARIRKARSGKEAVAIGYLGNIVDGTFLVTSLTWHTNSPSPAKVQSFHSPCIFVPSCVFVSVPPIRAVCFLSAVWERLAAEDEPLADIGSDQTSLHNPYGGGYYPVGLSFLDAQALMRSDPPAFKQAVQASLRRQVAAINLLVEKKGMRFWDYGNAFLLEASRAGADIMSPTGPPGQFRYPSYIQEFVGDVFSLGFGPFRWICTSGRPEDLRVTDRIARRVLEDCRVGAPQPVVQQLDDNLLWITRAEENKLVVGSQARILYADARARVEIALAFNAAIASGELSAPVVLSRDHHDVSGTDSPFRETSNVYDGSSFTADMALQNVIGDAARGATWVSIHNGGGVGWGEVTNGGFGLVLLGDDDSARRAQLMLSFDVHNGVARRAWAGNANARLAIERSMESDQRLKVTTPHFADDALLNSLFKDAVTPNLQ